MDKLPTNLITPDHLSGIQNGINSLPVSDDDRQELQQKVEQLHAQYDPQVMESMGLTGTNIEQLIKLAWKVANYINQDEDTEE